MYKQFAVSVDQSSNILHLTYLHNIRGLAVGQCTNTWLQIVGLHFIIITQFVNCIDFLSYYLFTCGIYEYTLMFFIFHNSEICVITLLHFNSQVGQIPS